MVELAVCRALVQPRLLDPRCPRISASVECGGSVTPLGNRGQVVRQARSDRAGPHRWIAARRGYLRGRPKPVASPSLFATSFTPLLLSTLTSLRRKKDELAVKRLSRDAMRWVLLPLPFVGLALGAAPEIVDLVFGPAFSPAAKLLPPLLLAAVAMVLVSVTTSILIAAERMNLTLACTAPLPVVAAIGYLIVIPRVGPEARPPLPSARPPSPPLPSCSRSIAFPEYSRPS